MNRAAHLRALIAAGGGSIPFERFMQEALYHPRFGYYTTAVRRIGVDFSTASTLHQALGAAIAGWAATHRRSVTCGGEWHLIELGGGGGELAAAILGGLGCWARRGLHYHLVDISPILQEQQRRRLRGNRRVTWAADIETALDAADGRALIFSNEFVDAFPCVQLVRDASTNGWQEVRVAWPEGTPQPVEHLAPVAAGGLETTTCSALDPQQFAPAAGQRIELHLSYRRWWSGWAPRLKTGRLLTIDYGAWLPQLYHRRPRGTLRAYFQHQRFEGGEVYHRFGRQDLTADVNFTDLRAWGAHLGFKEDSRATQAGFIRQWAPDQLRHSASPDPALAFLLDPDGAGTAFQVLEQVGGA